MNWLVHTVAEIFRWIATVIRGGTRSRHRQEDLYVTGSDTEQIIAPLREEGGYRKRVVHAIGPPASSDGIGWETEHVTYMDEDAVQMEVDFRVARRCDCGILAGYNNNSLIGTCSVCSRIVCNQEGCSARCERCGALTCARHTVKINKHTFCQRHSLYGRWLQFWGCLQ